MSFFNKLAWLLLFLGGLNWGILGLVGYNPIGELLYHVGAGAAERWVYVLVGVAAIWGAVACCKGECKVK